ncbi:lytic transglycosylase domain-containing protein [Bradyrhizobium sp. CCBAU 11434]|uniref:lytic transglycosylase domain-containing protein n=1 Tax=Bradyrhizobium sp. CCBAU 11434 TaxID=1630885 RepID=UPI0023053396|nr:lytic transglycosylase domain-containing protein [Bradyrhizobium sp. CCBAU 11434]
MAFLVARALAFASLLLICAVPYGVAVAGSGAATVAAVTLTSNQFAAFIDEASERFSVPENWIGSVIKIESDGDARAKSSKGATGLMQIMPAAWAELRERYNLGSDPYEPRDNILAGTAYLRKLLDRYGSPGAFAAYNAGPTRYEERLAGRSLPDETQAYLAKLATLLGIELPPTWTHGPRLSAAAALFAAGSDLMKTGDRSLELIPSSGVTTAILVHEVSRMVPPFIGVFVPRGACRAVQFDECDQRRFRHRVCF